ncbi:MAG: glycosyltransferase [Gemmatimonadota bacterium]|nr:glycosyltransferase [Gemmatimonadota bacterium]
MRVLFLAHSFPRHAGDAAGSFVLRLAQALQSTEGIVVRVVAPAAEGSPSREELGGVTVERYRYAPRSMETLAYTGTMASATASWRGRAALLGLVTAQLAAARSARRRFHPDVIHAHWWFPAGLVATFLAGKGERGGRLPLVTTAHGSDVRLGRRVRAALPLLRRVVARSAALTTVSRWLAEEIRALVPDAQPEVAPMAADTALFSPGGRRSADRLLYVGRLNEQKGITHLISAMPMMAPDVSLDVAGDGPLRQQLQERADRDGCAGRIRWLGTLAPDRLLELYRQAAAVVMPSLDEGLGLVAVEAMLCETPVIASRSGGLPDVVRDGITGLLVAPESPAALAAAVERLLALPESGAALGRAGRREALLTFSPPAVARRYADIYRAALGRPA